MYLYINIDIYIYAYTYNLTHEMFLFLSVAIVFSMISCTVISRTTGPASYAGTHEVTVLQCDVRWKPFLQLPPSQLKTSDSTSDGIDRSKNKLQTKSATN